LAVLSVVMAVTGCRRDMQDQPKYKGLRPSVFFEDGRSARPIVEGTIARGHLNDDQHLHAGKVDGAPATSFPFEVTRAVLDRGHERYDIYCSPCHDRTGGGNGMIVQRGFRRPSSFHIDRLREIPVGYFFEVMTHGFGTMPGYAAQVPPRDRWAIAAYVRALQLSQHARADDLTADDRARLDAPAAAPAPAHAPGGGHHE
jgi:mono/diheme cytochrome c family protein